MALQLLVIPGVAHADLNNLLAAIPLQLALPVTPAMVAAAAQRLAVVVACPQHATPTEIGEHHVFVQQLAALVPGPGAISFVIGSFGACSCCAMDADLAFVPCAVAMAAAAAGPNGGLAVLVANLTAVVANLTTVVNNGFLAVNGRLNGIDGRLIGIDGRLNGIDGRLIGIDGRLNGIDGRLNGIDGRLDTIHNSSARENSHAVTMCPNAAGVRPAAAVVWIPRTLNELRNMNGPQATALLVFYGIVLAPNTPIATKRSRLLDFLGIRVA